VLARWHVTAVFCGHIHSYLEDNVRGVPVYMSGGSGADLVESIAGYHYLVCTVDGDGRLAVRKVPVSARESPIADAVERVLEPRRTGRVLVLPATLCLVAGTVLLFRARRAVEGCGPGGRPPPTT